MSLFNKTPYNRSIRFKKKISLIYLLIVIIGALLLFSPLTTLVNNDVSLFNSFFISASAFSDTGLSPVNTVDYFNNFGQLIIIILVMIGGIGVMSIKIFLLMVIGKKISISDRMMIFNEQSQTNISGMVKLVKQAIIILIFFQLLFTCIITLHMIFFYNYDFLKALWFAFFHSTSAINNAGFDLTGNSFINFKEDYLFQTYIIILIIIGGLGFPILIDIKKFLICKKNKIKFKFSLFSKVSLYTYLLITLLSFILISIVDYKILYQEHSIIEGFYYSLFHVVSARSAGFITMDLANLSSASHLIIAILMFIGAAPASTGGGIRTTTFAIIFLYLKTHIINKNDVELFKRRLSLSSIYAAFITFTLAIFLIFSTSFFVISFDNDVDVIKAFFEVCSAFGTTGLSLDYTSQMSYISKFIIACVMIIGQIGISNTLILFLKNKNNANDIRFPEENIPIG